MIVVEETTFMTNDSSQGSQSLAKADRVIINWHWDFMFVVLK